jgi:hypothetical protein
LFVFEHDSDAWIWKREAIKLWEEAGDEVLGGGAGEGEGAGPAGLDWGWIEVFIRVISNKELLVCRCQVRHGSGTR